MATRNPTAVYPFLAIVCAAVVLFSVAAMIVIGLIPVYLSKKPVTLASITAYQTTKTYLIDVADDLPIGALSDSELAQLTASLQSSLNSAAKISGTVSVKSAEIIAGSKSVGDRKRRQGSSRVLVLIVLITGRNNGILIIIGNQVTLFIQRSSSTITILVVSIVTSRTTTVSPAIISTTTLPSGILSTTVSGRRRRRQEYEGPSTSLPVTYKD